MNNNPEIITQKMVEGDYSNWIEKLVERIIKILIKSKSEN